MSTTGKAHGSKRLTSAKRWAPTSHHPLPALYGKHDPKRSPHTESLWPHGPWGRWDEVTQVPRPTGTQRGY